MIKSDYGSVILKKMQYFIMQWTRNSRIIKKNIFYTQFLILQNGLDMIANIL